MYFPAAPITSLSDPAEYTTLPRRKHLYLGETVQFLLVLRFRNAAAEDGGSGGFPRRDQVNSLYAVATVCAAESWQQRPGEDQGSWCADGGEEGAAEWESETGDNRGGRPGSKQTFRQCSLVHIHSSSTRDQLQARGEPVKVRPPENKQ